MKIAGFLKISTLIKIIIGFALVVALAAYMLMKVNDTNWSSWLKTAMDKAVSETVYAEGDNSKNVTQNFDIPSVSEYRNETYDITWNSVTEGVTVTTSYKFVTVVVTRPTGDDKDITIRGTIIRNYQQVNKDYFFTIKKAA